MCSFMTYPETIKYLNSFVNYEKKVAYSYRQSFKLKHFQRFLDFIGNPQLQLKVIHIAGSKGKGSVCAFIAYILREAGFQVGLYTSPHLSDFRERIRILNPKSQFQNPSLAGSQAKQTPNPKSQIQKLNEFEGIISKKEICDLVEELNPKIEKFNKNSEYDDLTFFEIYTALAFQYFKNKKVDFVVLETGLGGRLDATNTCGSLISVITPLSLEHTHLLGNTLEEIAFEKASIIKKENKIATCGQRLVLSARQDRDAIAVIEKVANKNNAILFKEGKNFKFFKRNDSFDYQGLNYKINDLKINLLGQHQISNASLAIASIEALRYHNVGVEEKSIRQGLKNCFWPARFEVVSKDPLIILDGAQNSASVKVLHKAVKEKFPKKKIWLIFGISNDKELKDTCREVQKFNAKIILTKADNPRATEPQYLLRYFNTNSMILTNTIKDALNIAKANAKKQNDLILVTGSLFVCGEVREQLLPHASAWGMKDTTGGSL